MTLSQELNKDEGMDWDCLAKEIEKLYPTEYDMNHLDSDKDIREFYNRDF